MPYTFQMVGKTRQSFRGSWPNGVALTPGEGWGGMVKPVNGLNHPSSAQFYAADLGLGVSLFQRLLRVVH